MISGSLSSNYLLKAIQKPQDLVSTAIEQQIFENFQSKNCIPTFIEVEEIEDQKLSIVPRQKHSEKQHKLDEIRLKTQNFYENPVSASQSDLDRQLEILKTGSMDEKVDALILINDYIVNDIPDNLSELQSKANHLSDALCKVIICIFDRPLDSIPLKFTKYFLTVLNRVCSSKLIVKEIEEKALLNLTEQILRRLLIDNLDKLGEYGEGELVLKTLNGSMLRLLENCNTTRIFVVLIRLLTKYINDDSISKMPGLVVRCLLKLTKILASIVQFVEIDRVLLEIHEFLIKHRSIGGVASDEIGTKTIKTIINELVKLKNNDIWVSYELIRKHPVQDTHIER